ELGRLNNEVTSIAQRREKLGSQTGSINTGPLQRDSLSNLRLMNRALRVSSVPEAARLGKLIPNTEVNKFEFMGRTLREGLDASKDPAKFDAHIQPLLKFA